MLFIPITTTGHIQRGQYLEDKIFNFHLYTPTDCFFGDFAHWEARDTKSMIFSYHFFFHFRYALKSLDKKRIKMKQGETLSLNERIMLSMV